MGFLLLQICQVVRSVLLCLRSDRSDESTTVVRLLAFLLCSCFGVSAERVLQLCPSRPSAFVTSSGRGCSSGVGVYVEQLQVLVLEL
ncbi:hypothetical protein Bca101_029776 [Brassica carinata]